MGTYSVFVDNLLVADEEIHQVLVSFVVRRHATAAKTKKALFLRLIYLRIILKPVVIEVCVLNDGYARKLLRIHIEFCKEVHRPHHHAHGKDWKDQGSVLKDSYAHT